MKPLRDSFALDYIKETVAAFNSGKVTNENKNTYIWYRDVLDEYFSNVKETDFIRKALEEFKKSSTYNELLEYSSQENKKSPFIYGVRSTNVTLCELNSLARARHSVRWFVTKSVDRDSIEACIETASKAPSACNRQPFRYVIIDNKEQASKVASYAMGTGGFSENITNLAIVVGDLSAYPFERDRHVIYIDGALSSMLLMLAFKSKGIDSCPINWPDIESREKKMEKELNLGSHERPIMLIAFGYAESDSKIPFSEKKSVKELVEYA
ncbi:Nitroreductase-like protein (fragment) [Vibrio coralliirubri]